LRKVRDTDHLEPAPEFLKFGTDRVGRCPADPGIDLIKDQRAPLLVRGGERLDGQHDSGELASGCDSGEWPNILSWVRREVELQGIAAGRGPPGLVVRERLDSD